MSKIKIIIADSHFLSRKGLAILLEENTDFIVLSEALSASDLVNQAKFYQPDLIIIDYISANFSLENLKQIVKKYPNTRFLAITDIQSNISIAKALNYGVTSHLLKDCDQDEIVEAIYKTAKGETFMCGKIASAVLIDKTLVRS